MAAELSDGSDSADNTAHEIRCYRDLLEAISARKDALNLSHETIENICGLTKGHWDKVFGPSREKRMGWAFFDYMAPALGIKFTMRVDEPQALRMQSRWEGRNARQVRVIAKPLSSAVLDRAKAAIFQELGQRGGRVRSAKLSGKRRVALARRAARARWRQRRNGHAKPGRHD